MGSLGIDLQKGGHWVQICKKGVWSKRLNLLKYMSLMAIAYKFTKNVMTYSTINEYEARGTNNIVYCPRMLHIADATQGMQPIAMYNIASKSLQVQHPTIDSIHNAIKGAQSYIFNFFFQTFGDFAITRKLIFLS